jgi:hypothetical protein
MDGDSGVAGVPAVSARTGRRGEGTRWKNLAKNQRGVLNRVFHLNRRVYKAYLLYVAFQKLRKAA